MIPAIIVMGSLTWIILQTRESAKAKWNRRFARLAPLGRYLRTDAQCLWEALRSLQRPSGRPKRVKAPDYVPEDL